ncbi:TPA: phosphate uptake regulator PhoU [Candidatus Woesearchaeota archaeon]|nr:phosphate uptake regulator PhoU [Candidatus Woesearchaeota archaeon]
MKRRVIRHGRSTVIVSLPSSWVRKYGIDKGDEVEVREKGNALEIFVDGPVEFGAIELDVTGMGPALICSSVKSAYLNGFDEIRVSFQRPYAYSGGRTLPVSRIISDVVKELVGIEITAQSANGSIIREVSSSSLKEFDSVLRRMFLLLSEAVNNLARTGDDGTAAEAAKEECMTAQKLANYCLRCINRHGYPQFRKSYSLYHILATAGSISSEVLGGIYPGSALADAERAMLGQLATAIRSFSSFFFSVQQETLVEIESICGALSAQGETTQTPGTIAAARVAAMIREMATYRIGMR